MPAIELFADFPSTTVTSGGTTALTSDNSFTVASSSAFPAASTAAGTQFHVVDQNAPSEIIAVTNISGTTWTVTRGAEGTTPIGHTAGFTAVQVITAGWLNTASVLIRPSGDATGAADVAAFQAAASAGLIGELVAGATYYVNAPTIFPPGTGLICRGQSLQYYNGSITMPLTGAVIRIVPGFAGTTVNGQAVKAPIVLVSQFLGQYATGSSGQTFRGITIDGHTGPAPSGVDGIQAWGPVWGVRLENVGVFGVTGNGVTTNKTLFPAATTTVGSASNGGTISAIGTPGWTTPSQGVLSVASTTGFPTSGAFLVAASGGTTAIVTYTGLTSTSLTGCAYYGGSASGTVSTGNTVSAGDTTHFPDLWCVIGCHFGGNHGDGFNGSSISDSYFVASESTGNVGNGWTVNGDNFQFTGCKAEFNTVGWSLSAAGAHARAVRLTSCGTDSNTQHGISIAGASQWPVILTNIGLTNDGTADGSSGTLYAGLNVSGGAHVTVTGLHVLTETNNPANGILGGTGAYSVMLDNCEIYARVTPISIASSGGGTVLTGANVITGTGNWLTGTTTTAYQPVVAPGGSLADSGARAQYARYSGMTGQQPRETIPWYAAEGNVSPLTSTTLYLAVLPVVPGDVISNLGFVVGPTAFTGVSNWWTALYTLGGTTFLRQSANQTGPLGGGSAKPLALTSSYTVPPGTYSLLAGVMINATGMQPLRGGSYNAAQTDAATSLFTGAQQMAATATTTGGATAPAGPLTLSATGILVYMGAN